MMNLMQMMGQLARMMQGGGNPMQLLQQMAGQNPQMAGFLQTIQGKSPQQLRQMAENLAKERGTSIQEVAGKLQQMGFPVPGGMK